MFLFINFFRHQVFQISFYLFFFFFNCYPSLKNLPPLFQNPPSQSWSPLMPPLFKNFVGGSTSPPPPPTPSRKRGAQYAFSNWRVMALITFKMRNFRITIHYSVTWFKAKKSFWFVPENSFKDSGVSNYVALLTWMVVLTIGTTNLPFSNVRRCCCKKSRSRVCFILLITVIPSF